MASARTKRLVELLSGGTADVNCVFAPVPFEVAENERVLAVLPNTILLEPKSVRVRNATRQSSHARIVRGYSVGSGSYSSTVVSQDEIRIADTGTLVVTSQTVTFLGALETLCIQVDKILAVDQSNNDVAIHSKDQKKVETFRVAKGLTLSYVDNDKEVSAPFVGQALDAIISRAIADNNHRRKAA